MKPAEELLEAERGAYELLMRHVTRTDFDRGSSKWIKLADAIRAVMEAYEAGKKPAGYPWVIPAAVLEAEAIASVQIDGEGYEGPDAVICKRCQKKFHPDYDGVHTCRRKRNEEENVEV